MKKRMFISAARPNEVRGAIIDENGKLEAYELEVADAGLSRGNVYLGTVANTEPSLNAAFVDYGAPKQGFLPSQDVVPAAYHQPPKSDGRPKINEVLRRRRKILVQVVKDPIGNKGAALTTEISLAGRYVVFTPFDGSNGISRKIESEEERKRLRGIVEKLALPKGTGLIVRTSAEGQTEEELGSDIARLVEEWETIDKRASDRRTKSGTCLYADNDLVIRMLRDQYRTDCDEVRIDTTEAYEAALAYFKRTMPDHVGVVKLWDRQESLFSAHGLESQIAEIYERRVGLPSGGYLIIEPTEALTVVDVNSGKSTSQSSQAETAYATNLEAAEEIARQLRLRDIGGLVVVDFIDMSSKRHDRQVEKRLATALKVDRARTYVGQVSENGLLEINRQRIKQALRLQTHEKCPTCGGSGLVRGASFAAVSVLRRIEERAVNGRLREVHIDLNPDLANELQNTYRRDLFELEQRYGITIVVVARPGLRLSDEQIVWNEQPPQAESKGDFRAESRSGRSGGSRRRSERKSDTAASASDAEADERQGGDGKSGEQKADEAKSDEKKDASAGGRSGRRRRRRRRSRRRKPASQQVAASQDAQNGEARAGGDADAGGEATTGRDQKAGGDQRGDDRQTEAAPDEKRGRRRRTRRRKEPASDQPNGAAQASASESGGEARERKGDSGTSEDRQAGEGGAGGQKDAGDAEDARPKTTRRRRNRRKSSEADADGGADAKPQAGGSEATTSNGAAAGETDGSPPGSKRRRRRRTRRRDNDPGGEAGGGKPDASQPPSGPGPTG